MSIESSFLNNWDISREIFKKLPLKNQLLFGMSDKRARVVTEVFLNNPEITKTGFVWSECVGRADAHKWNKILGHLTHKKIKYPWESYREFEAIAQKFPDWNSAIPKFFLNPHPDDQRLLEDIDNAPYTGNHLIQACIKACLYLNGKQTFFDDVKKGLDSGYTKGLQVALRNLAPESDQHHELYFLLVKNNVIERFTALPEYRYQAWLTQNPKYMPQFLDFIFQFQEAIHISSEAQFAGESEYKGRTHLYYAQMFSDQATDDQCKFLYAIMATFSLEMEQPNIDWLDIEKKLENKPEKSKLDYRKLACFYLTRAWNLLQRHNVSDGASYLEKFKKLSGRANPVMAAVCEAQIMLYSGDPLRALNYCNEIAGYCLESKKKVPPALKILYGDCLTALGHYQQAIEHYRVCIHEYHNSPEVRIKLAHAHYCNKQPETALVYLDNSILIHHLPISANIYLQLKWYDKASKHYARFIKHHPDAIDEILLQAAECEHHLKNYTKALSLIMRVFGRQQSPEAFYAKAKRYFFANEPEKAIEFFSKANLPTVS